MVDDEWVPFVPVCLRCGMRHERRWYVLVEEPWAFSCEKCLTENEQVFLGDIRKKTDNMMEYEGDGSGG